MYIRGQEENYEYEDHDLEFCGKALPQTVQSPGPRLVLLFNAGSKSGSGFKARFRFETEYLIPIGTPAPNGSCHFTYRSVSRKQASNVTLLQGGASGRTLGFDGFDFKNSDILSRCCANPARFAAAKAESGRQWK